MNTTDRAHRPLSLIFGGSFDPPHRAHVTLPPLVADQLGADRLLYIPAAISPLKSDSTPTDASHRLAMLRLAVESIPRAEIITIELDRPGPSYTVDTLEELHQTARAGETFRLLIGADQAIDFHRWRDRGRVIDLAEPVVMLRPPWDRAAFRRALAGRFKLAEVNAWIRRVVEVPAIEASATEIRRRLASGESVEAYLPPAVEAYIRKHGLYGVRSQSN